MTTSDAPDKACAVPLAERLLRIPADLRVEIEHGPCDHSFLPVGHVAHEAAARIAELEAELTRHEVEGLPLVQRISDAVRDIEKQLDEKDAEIERLRAENTKLRDDWQYGGYSPDHEAALAEIGRLREMVNRLERLYAHGISGLLGDAGDVPVPYPHEHVALWEALVTYVERLQQQKADWLNEVASLARRLGEAEAERDSARLALTEIRLSTRRELLDVLTGEVMNFEETE